MTNLWKEINQDGENLGARDNKKKEESNSILRLHTDIVSRSLMESIRERERRKRKLEREGERIGRISVCAHSATDGDLISRAI